MWGTAHDRALESGPNLVASTATLATSLAPRRESQAPLVCGGATENASAQLARPSTSVAESSADRPPIPCTWKGGALANANGVVIANLLQSGAAASCADGASGLAFAAPAFAGASGAGDDVAGAAVATAAVTSGAGGATADADIATDCVGVATASVLGEGDVRGDARCETVAACSNLAGVADAAGTPLAASRRRLHQVQENSPWLGAARVTFVVQVPSWHWTTPLSQGLPRFGAGRWRSVAEKRAKCTLS
mmetsp:Transcript_48362/g.128060  ORF Transcript_48362/g.128060 Transcript_48362/m.128060 type:complete len:250 (+) Transcript_48362:1278-2027(+)